MGTGKLGHMLVRGAMFACTLLLILGAAGPKAPAAASTVNSNTDAPTAVKGQGVGFGLMDVERNQVGMNKRAADGKSYLGYAFPLGNGAQQHFCVLVTAKRIIVHIDAGQAAAAGFDIDDKSQQQAFMDMLSGLDEELSDGGAKLSELALPSTFTSKKSCKLGKASYSFDVEVEPGYYYCICSAPKSTDCSGLAEFCLSGQLLPNSQVAVDDAGSWLDQAAAFLDPAHMDYRPLWVSLKTAAVAMLFIFILGILAAWRCMHVKSRWKGILDSVFTIPMVLPPTVVGFILLMIFGKSTAFGRFLIDHGLDLVFSWPAAVIAATIVGFPLMYRTVLGAFENLDVNMLDAARTLGWSERRIFAKLMLPLTWPSIAAGIVLAFARAMGEFGATLFFAGNYAGVTQTMPIAIYFAWMGGSGDVATFWAVVVILISFAIILFINLYTAHAQRYRRLGAAGSGAVEAVAEDEGGFTIDEKLAAELSFGPAAGDASGASGSTAAAAATSTRPDDEGGRS